MGKVLYTDFEGVDTIISEMMDNPQFKKAVTRTNLYKFWDSILPAKFKNKSKPYKMQSGGIMTIACQNPVVAQELSLYKVILMNKFSPYATSLKIRVTDMKFTASCWNNIEG